MVKKVQANTNDEQAKSMNDEIIGDSINNTQNDVIRAAAAALGRLGGLKGGKARAESLSPSKRSEIAKKAANARWAK